MHGRHVLLQAMTLGRGDVPYFPSEIRQLIMSYVFVCVTCRTCERPLCFTKCKTNSSYLSLMSLERRCLSCYSEGLI